MKKMIREMFLFLIILFVVPVMLVVGICGRDAVVWEKKSGIEDYLPTLLMQDIPMEMKIEAIKAQAVLTRSNVTKALREGELSFSDLKNQKKKSEEKLENKKYWAYYEKCLDAVQKTNFQVLAYEKQVQYVPFHRLSAGVTRDGWEVLQKENYAFCSGVDSSSDVRAKEYRRQYFYSHQELTDILNAYYPEAGLVMDSVGQDLYIAERDSAGYVLQMQVGNLKIPGEEFRRVLGFASSHFDIEESGDQIRFISQGIGHGLGMSQYGADEMARNGADYLAILEHYFPQMDILYN
ncbi:MAG: SpoIID/LytB domain-containing protein [Lachnospiraceae bacterium]|nr:SpoIID/LytB domain-containing protein [Lachnospiraceae bacterium]